LVGPRSLAALAGVVALTATACGVGAESSAHHINRQAVPSELLDPATTTTSTTRVPPEVTVTTVPLQRITLYFVRTDHVARVDREVESVPSTVNLLVLLTTPPPAPGDSSVALRTAVPARSVTAVSVSGGIATVDLATPFTEVSARDQTLAFAQMTYTLTALPGIGLVSFTLNGARIDVPGGDGSIVVGPVSRDTYRNLVS
jgi:spore germination protein GerM